MASMAWSRDGAHSVIQIRTSDYSKKWNEDWKLLKSHIYKMPPDIQLYRPRGNIRVTKV
jgi:hypothetical protein